MLKLEGFVVGERAVEVENFVDSVAVGVPKLMVLLRSVLRFGT